jgi:hypothetical protein
MIGLLFSLIILSSDCGYGLPCGPIPWDLPSLPRIMSPTPIPTVHIVPTTTPTSTPIPTAMPETSATPAPTQQVDEMVDDLLGDIGDLINQTPIPIEYDGQEVDFDSISQYETGTLWGYLRGILTIDAGIFTPILSVAVFGLFAMIFTKSSTLTIPLIAFAVGVVRKIITFVKSFIPGLR